MIFTPYPLGIMPDDVYRYTEDPSRLILDVEDNSVREGLVVDRSTGYTFVIRQADCGLGCFCAAEAVYINPEAVKEYKRLPLDGQSLAAVILFKIATVEQPVQ